MDLLIISEKTPDRNYVILADNKINKVITGINNLVRRIHVVCDENYCYNSSLKKILFHPVKNFKKISEKNTLLRLLYHLIYVMRVFLKSLKLIKKNPEIKFIINISGHFTIGLINVLAGLVTGRRSLLRLTESVQAAYFLDNSESLKAKLLNKLSYALAVILEKIVFRLCDKIISVVPPEYYPNIRGFEPKTVFIPDTILTNTDKRVRVKHSEKKIFFVGRLELEKNPFMFLKSILKVAEIRSDFKTLIIGSGKLEEAIRDFIKRNGLDDIVELIKPMPHNKFINLLNECYLLVNSSYIELMPNTILEALACGVPVIAPAIGGIPYLLNHGYNGFLLKNRDQETLAKLINKILDDEQLREKMSFNCKKFFEEIVDLHFGMKAVYDKYAILIKN
ncbi:MAG: glycosyltransferase family 4 protein [Candidatus Odinarchaeum yellowstonii]|uniref:Glycosyltransferase family 4 protein n=1 Tax=Odinarchaeota yellowstonii (strain LCB_4) TaxID=1841599 RepID=A0AAF0D282_ODILC|nr:MAG: glycosyltransferase family 4 protein [Candidatus Odinarchaeum yellowstonii]